MEKHMTKNTGLASVLNLSSLSSCMTLSKYFPFLNLEYGFSNREHIPLTSQACCEDQRKLNIYKVFTSVSIQYVFREVCSLRKCYHWKDSCSDLTIEWTWVSELSALYFSLKWFWLFQKKPPVTKPFTK